jgi:outer membrane immunogenic protein
VGKSGIAMKRIVLAAIALSIVAAAGSLNSASAADMAVKAPMTAGPAPIGLWEGLYIGGNVGYAWSKTGWCTDATINPGGCAAPTPGDQVSMKPSGAVGGGQVGYRFKFGNFVFGPEAMLDAMTIHSMLTDTNPGVGAGANRTTTFSGIMSVTGNAGLAFDRFLAYGKGGWALTHTSFDATSIGDDLKGNEYVQGWTAGGGLEYTLPSGWSVGVEYDYYRFNPGNMINMTSAAGAAIPCGFCNFGNQTNVQTILARLNVRIGPMLTN